LSCELDLRSGGAWRIHTRSPDGMYFSEYGVFREIVAPERIVFTHGFDMPGKPPSPMVLATALSPRRMAKRGSPSTRVPRHDRRSRWS